VKPRPRCVDKGETQVRVLRHTRAVYISEEVLVSDPKMEIELVRGTRRRKHVEAVLVGDRVRVSFPRWMSLREAEQIAGELAEQLARRVDPSCIDVAARARRLAKELGLPRPRSVQWSDQQSSRWGSCTPDDASIRVSSRLAKYPTWVLDYVLVHELAHLLVDHHGPKHDALVDRYPLAERARGFLIAKDLHPDDDELPVPEPPVDTTVVSVGSLPEGGQQQFLL
jgi:predicted metal-dependent hydrolase